MRVRPLLICSLAASLAACRSGVIADTAKPDAAAPACVAPTVGAPCSASDTPCQPGPCDQYDWFCNADTHVWQADSFGRHPPPSCFDAGADAASDASGTEAAAADGSPTAAVDAGPPVLTCSYAGQGGSSGGDNMDLEWAEKCNDGTTHYADCWCPTAFCCCDRDANCDPLDGGGAVRFDCDAGLYTEAGEHAAFAACGFPQPQ